MRRAERGSEQLRLEIMRLEMRRAAASAVRQRTRQASHKGVARVRYRSLQYPLAEDGHFHARWLLVGLLPDPEVGGADWTEACQPHRLEAVRKQLYHRLDGEVGPGRCER